MDVVVPVLPSHQSATCSSDTINFHLLPKEGFHSEHCLASFPSFILRQVIYNAQKHTKCSSQIASCLLKHLKENVTNTEAENLVLYSDSCGGQNRNIYMVCALLYIVSSADFPFTQIDHEFMVPGHSCLPNDRDFGSVETAQRRREHIYVPDHWYKLICSA